MLKVDARAMEILVMLCPPTLAPIRKPLKPSLIASALGSGRV